MKESGFGETTNKGPKLIEAVKANDFALVTEILTNITPQEINYQDESGFTALHSSIKNPKIAAALLNKQADISIRSNPVESFFCDLDGLDPIGMAIYRGDKDSIKFIIDYLKSQKSTQSSDGLPIDSSPNPALTSDGISQSFALLSSIPGYYSGEEQYKTRVQFERIPERKTPEDLSQGLGGYLYESRPLATYGSEQLPDIRVESVMITKRSPAEEVNSIANNLHVAASINTDPGLTSELINRLYETGKYELNAKDSAGLTPLHRAIQAGNHEAIETLLKLGANVNSQQLKDQSEESNLILKLQMFNEELEKQRKLEPMTFEEELLHFSSGVASKKPKITPSLSSAKSSFEALKIGNTPLIMALKKFRHKSDKLDLIDADIALTEREKEKIKTTNQEKQEDLHMISMILENPQINFNTPGENWKTALHIVAEKSMHESMKAFLSSKKFDIIDSQDDSGDTALHIAARKGDIEMVNILLAYEASVIIKNQEGKTAPALLLEFHQKNLDSIKKQQKSITDSMQTDGSSLGEPQQALQTQQNALIALSHQKDALSVQRTTLSLTTSRLKVIEGASDPNVGLYNAVINNDPKEVAEALRNTNPNIEDANKVTPLHIAVEKGNLEIVKLLIDKKAITSRSNLVGETALHIAVRRNIPEIAAHLLKNKPAIYCCVNGFGETSFDLTVEGKNPEMLRLHMPYFIKEMKNSNQELFSYYNKNTVKIVKNILENPEMREVFLGFKDENQQTILHIACANGLKDLVSLFLEKKVAFDIKDGNNKTALDLARERKQTSVIELIEKTQSSPSATIQPKSPEAVETGKARQ